jgi:hypothetical protein
MKTKFTKTIETLFVVATIVWTANAFVSQKTLAQASERPKGPMGTTINGGLFSTTLNSMPVSSVLAGMAIEEAARGKAINWDAAITLSDEMIELGREAVSNNPEAHPSNDTDIGRTIGIHLREGAIIWTEKRLASGKILPNAITNQREAFEARKMALAEKYGEDWVNEAVAEAVKLSDKARAPRRR